MPGRNKTATYCRANRMDQNSIYCLFFETKVLEQTLTKPNGTSRVIFYGFINKMYYMDADKVHYLRNKYN